jgi:hypothetical protein
MNARQQLARVVPLAVLVLLAAIGLRSRIPGPRWDGPLRAYGVVIGIAIEVICVVLLVVTYYRERAARRQEFEALRAQASGGTAGAASAVLAHDPDADIDDRDVAQSLRFHLRLLLVASMLAVAAALLVNLHLHWFNGRPRTVIKLPQPISTKTLQPRPLHVAVPSTVVHSFVYGLLVAALLVVLVVSIWWARRLSRSLALPAIPGDATADDESQGLREAVASGRAAMTDLDDARAAIIACYEAMEQSLAERGAAREVAGTPDELLTRATDRNLIRGDAARRLTRLFYEARFSSHRLGVDARDAAAAALDELAAELGGVPR